MSWMKVDESIMYMRLLKWLILHAQSIYYHEDGEHLNSSSLRPVSIVEYKSQKKLKNEKLYSKPVSISQFILLFCHFLFLTYTTEEYNQNVGWFILRLDEHKCRKPTYLQIMTTIYVLITCHDRIAKSIGCWLERLTKRD